MAAQERVTVSARAPSTSLLAEKEGLHAAEHPDLSPSGPFCPLASARRHSYDYVYDAIKPDVHLCNISGGTEIISCFAIANRPTVWRGSCRPVGSHGVDVLADGRPLRGAAGDAGVHEAFPACRWRSGTTRGLKYRGATYSSGPRGWRQGDWPSSLRMRGDHSRRSDAIAEPRGACASHRRDLSPGRGVPEVLESLAIGQRSPRGRGRRAHRALCATSPGVTLDR